MGSIYIETLYKYMNKIWHWIAIKGWYAMKPNNLS